MSLQKRFLWLLVVFATFALLSTFATTYAVRLHVEGAISSMQRTQDEAAWVEQLRVRLAEQELLLKETIAGERSTDQLLEAQRDALFNELRQVAQFTLPANKEEDAGSILDLTEELRQAFEECLASKAAGRIVEARILLEERISRELMPALDLRLKSVRVTLDDERTRAVDQVVASNTQVLALGIVIAVVGVTLVILGTVLIRRWILMPMRSIEAATSEYGAGRFSHRVDLTGGGLEFEGLGEALNRMARNLGAARVELQQSEAKYRSLFDNLRDATLICDASADIIECHDGETNLLGRLEGSSDGKSVLDIWPSETESLIDWAGLIGHVLARRERIRITGVRIAMPERPERHAIVDIIAFPVALGTRSAVAIALRDVTEQRQSELQARRTEAMQAMVTMARGVAHDFSSLLTSAIGSLSILNSELGNGRPSELVRRALRACGQAVSLSRTLMSFAGGDRGKPEILNLRETVELILASLDETFLEGIDVETDLDSSVTALVDRDQFTEIVLNLIRNGCEAMPGGGRLTVHVSRGRLPSMLDTEGPPTHAVLRVSDTGHGIAPEMRQRLFEPFFSTKSEGQHRSRGMGLAIVYAAAKNAGGLVTVVSEQGAGATFEVFLPLPEPGQGTPPVAARGMGDQRGSVAESM